MCGGDCETGRASAGGTIAVLRPSQTSGRVVEEPVANCDLMFDNAGTKTRATLRTKNGGCFDSSSRYLVVIHRDGDLTASPKDELLTAMHAIPIAPRPDSRAHRSVARMELAEALDLTVGTTGVIGRRVSILSDGLGARVAEGIIGFN